MKTFLEELAAIKQRYDSQERMDAKNHFLERLRQHPTVIFGASFIGDSFYDTLLELGIKIVCFCDGYRKGTTPNGNGPIITPDELIHNYPKANILLSVSEKRTEEIITLLKGLGYSKDCIFPAPGVLLAQGDWESFSRHIHGYEWAYNFFRDDISKQIILGRIERYLFGTYVKSTTDCEEYFEKGIINLNSQEVFVDGGGYIGDSTKAFIRHTDNHYRHIYVFEPSKEMVKRAKETLSGYENVTVIEKGLWSGEKGLDFYVISGMGASGFGREGIQSEEVVHVPTDSLDNIFFGKPSADLPTYIKLDIEGAEKEALSGAKAVISKARPKLAVCVYHKPEDVYEIPQTIADITDGYTYHLIQCGNSINETILYACPAESRKNHVNITVIGLGFVGLTAALGFADRGFSVRGFDSNKEFSRQITNGIIPFLEPGLPEALQRTLGRDFSVASSAEDAVKSADIIFFCVGTPCDVNGNADLTSLLSAIDSVAEFVRSGCVFVVKSTVPPGTTEEKILPYVREKEIGVSVAVNPEFLRESYSWMDFTVPDRIVCGVELKDDNARKILAQIYSPFNAPIHFVTPNTAEFIKYLSNSMLATLISFSNEMAALVESVGSVNVGEAFKILHEDHRLKGSGIASYIYPGCGYGGYCLPKDTVALSALARERGFEPNILNEVIALNNRMPVLTAEKIKRSAKSRTEKIGVLGLSFKPDSDDVRDSSAAKIIKCLIDGGYSNIYAYDPVAADRFRDVYALDIIYCETKEQVCEECDIIALVTTWKEFYGIDKYYPRKIFVDCRYYL